MITKCPAELLIKLGLKNRETGDEIVYNPSGFDYHAELEAITLEAASLLSACKDPATRKEMKKRWGCSTMKELDHQYTSVFARIVEEATHHHDFQAGEIAEVDGKDYTVNNEVRVLQEALSRVRDVPLNKREWP